MSSVARLGLAAVTVIGSIVDWLTLPTPRQDRDRFRIDRAPLTR